MREVLNGWLLDIYADEQDVVLWLITESGERRRLVQGFPAAFYAAGDNRQLRALWRWLQEQAIPVRLSRAEREDVFKGMTTVLAAEVPCGPQLEGLFRRAAGAFPDLTYYDGDISLSLRYAAANRVFPLGRCQAEVSEDRILNIVPLDSPWDIDPEPAPLRILSLIPDRDPARGTPRHVVVSYGRVRYVQPVEPSREFLITIYSLLKKYDPDLIITSWGDSWLMPHLQKLSKDFDFPLPLNREGTQELVERKERTYFSYGMMVHKDKQFQLRGRLHLDHHSAVMWDDYELEGIFEMARVTALPIQDAARLSAGTGISSMQFITALREKTLIPWHKDQTEEPKTSSELLHADMGGMVYQPTIGLHRDVGGIDFVSMYPGIIVHFNISPGKPGLMKKGASKSGDDKPGIVPLTLAPLLDKRVALKSALAYMHPRDCRRGIYKARASAEKWLLIVCFGYLGYANARFGCIEAHEAITQYAREALLLSKEAAEGSGFSILHMYVDGLWIRKPGCTQAADFQPLLAEITRRTGIPIALDGIYRWVVFLPSRVNDRSPVPNRYFGVFQDGSIKVRGIEARRHDTPDFIVETQMGILEILAKAPEADRLPDFLPEAHRYVGRRLDDLMKGRVPLEELVIGQRLSRELSEFSTPSPPARAAWQLQAAGKPVSAGQNIQYLFTRDAAGVRAWYTLEEEADSRIVDTQRYQVLLMRAVEAVLKPIEEHFGVLPYASTYGLFPQVQDRRSTGKKIQQFLETTLVSRDKVQAGVAEGV